MYFSAPSGNIKKDTKTLIHVTTPLISHIDTKKKMS